MFGDVTRAGYLDAIKRWGEDVAQLEVDQIEIEALERDLHLSGEGSGQAEEISVMIGRVQQLKEERRERLAGMQRILRMLSEVEWE